MKPRTVKKDDSLTAQVRQAKMLGARVFVREGKLKIKDPAGVVTEKSLPPGGIVDADYVKRIVNQVYRDYLFQNLSDGCPFTVKPNPDQPDRAEWKLGELTVYARSRSYELETEVCVSNSAGLRLERNIEGSWPNREKLRNFLTEMRSDFGCLERLKAYLSTEKQSLRIAHGTRIAGTIHVTVERGKMQLSCWDESDFANLRRVLDTLEGFAHWKTPLDVTAVLPQLETPLDLE